MSSASLAELRGLLTSQHAAPSHGPRLAALRDLAERSPHCLALALVGSFAQHRGDRISDLDLAAIVVDGSEASFMAQAQPLLGTNDVLADYGQAEDGAYAFRKVVYLDFTSCELHAFSRAFGFKLHQPYVAVWDPSDLLASLVVDGAPPAHESFDAYPHGDAGLVWELFDCIKWLRRGRTTLAKDYLRKLVRAIDAADADPTGR